MANKALQQTKPALASFGIFLSHNGLLSCVGSLPVVTARFWLLKAGVSTHIATVNKNIATSLESQKNVSWNCVFFKDMHFLHETIDKIPTYTKHVSQNVVMREHERGQYGDSRYENGV